MRLNSIINSLPCFTTVRLSLRAWHRLLSRLELPPPRNDHHRMLCWFSALSPLWVELSRWKTLPFNNERLVSRPKEFDAYSALLNDSSIYWFIARFFPGWHEEGRHVLYFAQRDFLAPLFSLSMMHADRHFGPRGAGSSSRMAYNTIQLQMCFCDIIFCKTTISFRIALLNFCNEHYLGRT